MAEYSLIPVAVPPVNTKYRTIRTALPVEIVKKVEEGIKSGAITSRCEQFKGKSLKAFLQGKQKEVLQRTVESVSGDKGKPAVELGASLASLYRKRSSN